MRVRESVLIGNYLADNAPNLCSHCTVSGVYKHSLMLEEQAITHIP